MSYDVYLAIDTGGGEMADVVEIGNYTSNVAPMWHKALPPDGIAGLDGRRCDEVEAALGAAVERMEQQPDEYIPLEPENGWGDYGGATAYLKRLAIEASKHPACVIRVSR